MPVTLYTTCSPITIGCFLYLDAGLTTIVNNGKYSDGTNCFGTTFGEVLTISACPTTTTTTSTSTTTTTTVAITAEISIYGEDDGGGELLFTALVTSGTTLDIIGFEGEVTRYTSADCTTGTLPTCGLAIISLGIGVSTANSGAYCTIGTGVSVRVTSCDVGGTMLTTSPQTVLIGGNYYKITGFEVCTPL